MSDAEYDALRRRYEAIEAGVPEPAHAGEPVAQGRRGAGARLRQGAPRGADAVAAECVRRRGGRRFRRAHPPLPQSEGGRAGRVHRRAEDRRALDVAALRGRRAGQGRHPRRRLRGRGRHRQYPDGEGGPAPAQGQENSAGLRNPRRNLHDQGGLPRAQQAAGGGGRAGVRQSAQLGGRLVAAEGPEHHRVAAAALLRLYLGRDRATRRRRRSPA